MSSVSPASEARRRSLQSKSAAAGAPSPVMRHDARRSLPAASMQPATGDSPHTAGPQVQVLHVPSIEHFQFEARRVSNHTVWRFT